MLNAVAGSLPLHVVQHYIDIIGKGQHRQGLPPSRYKPLFHALGRPHEGKGWEATHGAFYFLLWALFAGTIDIAVLNVGTRASDDNQRDANQHALDQLVQFGIRATVDKEQNGSKGEPDGWFTSSAPLMGTRQNDPSAHDIFDGSWPQQWRQRVWISSLAQVPLEIGDSYPSRTYRHLCEYQAVARWPKWPGKLLFILMLNEHGHDDGAFPIRDLPDMHISMLNSKGVNDKVVKLLISTYVQLTTVDDPDYCTASWLHARKAAGEVRTLNVSAENDTSPVTFRSLFDLERKDPPAR